MGDGTPMFLLAPRRLRATPRRHRRVLALDVEAEAGAGSTGTPDEPACPKPTASIPPRSGNALPLALRGDLPSPVDRAGASTTSLIRGRLTGNLKDVHDRWCCASTTDKAQTLFKEGIAGA
jgi:hypothetical protein